MDKFIDIIDVDEYEVLTPHGWKDFSGIGKTKLYQTYEIILESEKKLKCADDHILMNNKEEKLAKNLIEGHYIDTSVGKDKVKEVVIHDTYEHMYDLLNVTGSVYYTNDIVSHNTLVTGIYALWYAIFHPDKYIAIGSNSAKSAQDFLSRIKMTFEELDFWLKPGVNAYNEFSLKFENGSQIQTAATSKNAFRGRTINCIGGNSKITVITDFDELYYTTIKKAKKIIQEDLMNIKKEKKYYTVYETINLINGKTYVGFHSTDNLDDGYLGSGKALRRAVEKHGPESFSKEILGIFDNIEEASRFEKNIVDEEYVKRVDTYNMSLGGNVCILFGENNGFYGKEHTLETKAKISKASSEYRHTDEAKEKISKTSKARWEDEEYHLMMCENMKGRVHSEETKKKMSKSGKGKIFTDEHRENISMTRKALFENMTEEEYVIWYEKSFTKERNNKISDSLTGRKKPQELVDRINKNPEKIRKTAEKHRGMKRSEESKEKMSKAAKGRIPWNKGIKVEDYVKKADREQG